MTINSYLKSALRFSYSKLGLIAAILFVISISLGFYFAEAFDDHSHAGRGGAVGVIISFAALFLQFSGQYSAVEFFDRAEADVQRVFGHYDTDDQKEKVIKLKWEALNRDGKRQRKISLRRNLLLTTIGGLSTFVWGFGDLIAGWLL